MKYKLLAIILLLSAGYSFAQTITNTTDDFAKKTDFFPPAPNAAAITKAAVLGTTKNTGAVNVNIPVVQLNGKKLNVAVSLNYASSGIKVDELASRVGMGWSLNAGGVITRIIRGAPDEYGTRVTLHAPITDNWASYNFMAGISNINGIGADNDPEPDLFNFSFGSYSGAFVLDSSMNAVQIPSSPLKIEKNFFSTDWNFKITTPDGVRYYFGGSNATEISKRLDNAGTSIFGGSTLYAYLPTAWYLIKIEHSNGETINFSYTPIEYNTYDSTVETMDHVAFLEGNDPSCVTFSPTTNINRFRNTSTTKGQLLTGITTATYGALKFKYSSRSDGNDKLLQSIQYYNQVTGDTIRQYKFNYTDYGTFGFSNFYSRSDAIPYLTSFKECSADSSVVLIHRFSYIDPAARPDRLSYAQDHWGYFNGQSNSSFCPYLDGMTSLFPYALANRESNFAYAVKGMLNKIIYPTGGCDSIIYEPNLTYTMTTPATRNSVTKEVTGTGLHTQVGVTQSFTLTTDQDIVLNNTINCSETDCDEPATINGKVQITDASSSLVFNQTYVPNSSAQERVHLSAGEYTLNVFASGSMITTTSILQFYDDTHPAHLQNTDGAGLRVKYIVSAPGQGNKLIKHFIYSPITNLSQSSIAPVPDPDYLRTFNTGALYLAPSGIVDGMGNPITFYYCNKSHVALHSNSLSNLFSYMNAPVTYSSILETSSTTLEGGVTETKFDAISDIDAETKWGEEEYFNGTKTNFSATGNGRIKEENVYKYSGSTLTKLKSTINHYNYDTRRSAIMDGYFDHAPFTSVQAPPAPVDLSASGSPTTYLPNYSVFFSLKHYQIYCPWIYKDSVTEVTYDSNGLNPLSRLTIYFYDNELHEQLTRTETHDSRGNLVKTENKYPHDYATIAPYDQMISNNMTGYVVDSKIYKNTFQAEETYSNYHQWANNNFDIDTIKRAFGAAAFDIEGRVTQRDNDGNILEYVGRDGVVQSILWGYDHTYPVAKITGASYSAVQTALGISDSALQSLSNSQLETDLNNLRAALPSAMITGYIYQPLVGVISTTDAKGYKKTFEYDNLNRLVVVRDKDGNVTQSNSYNYTNNAGINVGSF